MKHVAEPALVTVWVTNDAHGGESVELKFVE
jgi:hypothetical protein